MRILAFVVVTLLLAGSSRSQKPTKGREKSCNREEIPQVIRFHFGAQAPPLDHLVNEPNPETQAGFGIRFARLLCEMNSLRCEFIRQSYNECWTQEDYPGRGVYDGSFDACSTYTHTYLRQTGVDFGDAYLVKRPAGILARLDQDLKPVISPKTDNLTGTKIAGVKGWDTSLFSLRYVKNGCTGNKFIFPGANPKQNYATPEEALKALADGDVDALFLPATIFNDRKNCDLDGCIPELSGQLGKKFSWIHTGLTGHQVNGTTLSMTRKGSKLNDFLNPMIQGVLKSKEYADLCTEYDAEDIECFSNDFTGNYKTSREAMDDRARTRDCNKEGANCNECSSGYCGCSTKRG